MGYQKLTKLRHSFLWDIGGSGDSSTATGAITIFSAPANTLIHDVEAEVLTAVTGSTAEEVGDGGDQDGYLVDNFAAGTGFYPPSAEHATCGVYAKATTAGATDALDVSRSAAKKFNATATPILYTITGTATAGKIRFWVDFTVVA